MRIVRYWIAALAALLAAPALAQPDTPPSWTRKPSASDLLAVWPSTALARRAGGQAAIRCTISARGALSDCALEHESPAGAGFGAAALTLAPRLRLKPGTHDGQSIVTTAILTIGFPDPDDLTPSTGSLLPEGAPGAHVEIATPPPALSDY
jgi:TonB family protein